METLAILQNARRQLLAILNGQTNTDREDMLEAAQAYETVEQAIQDNIYARPITRAGMVDVVMERDGMEEVAYRLA